MWQAENGGYYISFETSTGKYSKTWFSNPPDSIDHVDKAYLKGRLWNVTRDYQVEFIKTRFKEEFKKIKTLTI